MSLINQMLKDLERREKTPIDPEITLSGLLATDSPRYAHHRKKRHFRLSLVFLASAIFLIMTHKFGEKIGTHSLSAFQEANLSSEIQSVPSTPAFTFSEPMQLAPAVLTGISLETMKDQTEMRFLLNRNTRYTVSTNANQTILVLLLDRTNLIADMPPVDYVKSAISGMEITNDAFGNLKITLALHPGTTLDYLNTFSSDKASELRVKLFYHAPDHILQSSNAPSFSVKKTDEYNAKLQYQNALNYANVGDKDKAIESLTELLQRYPGYISARESLISLLLQLGNNAKARKMVELGLEQKPYYPPFIEIKARMLVGEGKIIQAKSLLERAPPPIDVYPDYHAFLAALYQQLGETEKARELYQELVQLNPARAVFWAGLGISLENTGKPAEAKEVYQHAMQLQGLTPPLQAYLEKRIDDL